MAGPEGFLLNGELVDADGLPLGRGHEAAQDHLASVADVAGMCEIHPAEEEPGETPFDRCYRLEHGIGTDTGTQNVAWDQAGFGEL